MCWEKENKLYGQISLRCIDKYTLSDLSISVSLVQLDITISGPLSTPYYQYQLDSTPMIP